MDESNVLWLGYVQEFLGHEGIRTISRYAHLSRERFFAAVESVPRAG